MERLYRADYDVVGTTDMTDEFFVADDDKTAIEMAKEYAKLGKDYISGHNELELVQVVLVDETTEYFNEIKTIYW